MVINASPFHSTVDEVRKPDPLKVNVRLNTDSPAVAELGLRIEMLGACRVIPNATALELTPPGFSTVTRAVPWPAIRLADTEAGYCAPWTKVVEDRAEPFHCTADPARNPEPFTASVIDGPPAIAEPGVRLGRP